MPALSILLPTFNGARFLEQQLSSIMAQSFADWELLLCDDGSTDGTGDLLSRYAAQEPRIRLLPTSGNEGQKRRISELSQASRAEMIAISDQDDIWHPDKLAILMQAIGSADLCFGSSWLIDAEGAELGWSVLDNFSPRYEPGEALMLLFRPAVSAHAMIVRRELLLGSALARGRPFDWLLSLEAAFGKGLVYEPAARTMHRMHATNQMNGNFATRRADTRLTRLRNARRRLAHLPVERYFLLAHSEHLAFSATVPKAVATSFRKVHQLCFDAWYNRSRSPQWSGRDLAGAINAELAPHAGSERDKMMSQTIVEALAARFLHPRQLAGIAR